MQNHKISDIPMVVIISSLYAMVTISLMSSMQFNHMPHSPQLIPFTIIWKKLFMTSLQI